jgi:hypothetical protein
MRRNAASDPLEDWVDKAIRRCAAAGFPPGRFLAMWATHTTVGAIERLMNTPFEQTPLHRPKQANLLEWSLEACVLEFPGRFKQSIRDVARFRYNHADDASLGAD